MKVFEKLKKLDFMLGNKIRKTYLSNGQSFWVTNKDKGMSKDIFVNHTREENALKYFLECLNKDDIVFDVGANMGFYVLQEALITKKVIAVEPSKLNYTFLNLNVFENDLKNVDCYELAISKTNGLMDFFVSEYGNLSTLVFREKSHNYHTERVLGITGKDFLDNYNHSANVLRMDVEGYELEILRSFKEELKSFDKIFLEVHKCYLKEKELELFDVLDKAGFDFFWYVPDEKIHGKYERRIVDLKELKGIKRERVYHLFCFKEKGFE